MRGADLGDYDVRSYSDADADFAAGVMYSVGKGELTGREMFSHHHHARK